LDLFAREFVAVALLADQIDDAHANTLIA